MCRYFFLICTVFCIVVLRLILVFHKMSAPPIAILQMDLQIEGKVTVAKYSTQVYDAKNLGLNPIFSSPRNENFRDSHTYAILGTFDMQYLPRETSSKDGSPDRMPHQGLVQLRRVGQEVSQVVVAQGAKGLLRRHEDGPRPRVRHQDAEEGGGAECS